MSLAVSFYSFAIDSGLPGEIGIDNADAALAKEIRPIARRCPLCRETDLLPMYHPKLSPGPIVRCMNCRLVFVSPLVNDEAVIKSGPVIDDPNSELLTSSDLTEFPNSWERSLLPEKELELSAARLNGSDALDWVEEFKRQPGRLLDFGSGWGFFLSLAKARGWESYGLDPLPFHSAYARVTSGATVVTDTLREDTFPEDTFDAVTAFQVFEHLPDPAGDLNKLYRVLRSGGVILIEVPNIETSGVRLLGPHHRHFVPDHINFFSADTLQSFLSEHGFEILDVRFPTRRMSVRYLMSVWLPRYLPQSFVGLIEWSLKRLSVWELMVPLNLGDIVAVLARKP